MAKFACGREDVFNKIEAINKKEARELLRCLYCLHHCKGPQVVNELSPGQMKLPLEIV